MDVKFAVLLYAISDCRKQNAFQENSGLLRLETRHEQFRGLECCMGRPVLRCCQGKESCPVLVGG